MRTKFHLPGGHTLEHVVLGVAAALVLVVLIMYIINFTRKVNYERRWKELQKLLGNKATWKDAVVEADRLLDSVLKKHHYKGKTMGERLVSAQHDLSANDKVWFSHKLSNKIVSDGISVTKNEVKKGLLGFWQALKDLGVFGKKDPK